MGKLENFLTGVKVLEEIESPLNGKLTVVKDFAWGTYVKGGGLTQSGGIMSSVWKSALKNLKKRKINFKEVLILGLGGGDVARIVSEFWPKSIITGVEIDPIMVELGKKYLELKENKVEIIIEDAAKFVKKKPKDKYDLVLIDLYVGEDVPEKINSLNFFKSAKKFLKKDGILVVNRLYYGLKRKIAEKTRQDLEKIFPKVETVFPEANIMFICLQVAD